MKDGRSGGWVWLFVVVMAMAADRVLADERVEAVITGEQTVVVGYESPRLAPSPHTAPLSGGQMVQSTALVDSNGNVVQPPPLEVEGGGRDPFAVSAKKILSPDYGRGIEGCRLRGVIKIGGRQVALFLVSGKEGSMFGSSDQLRRVSVGEKIQFYANNNEYAFTVRAIDARSVVLVGENAQVYKIWL